MLIILIRKICITIPKNSFINSIRLQLKLFPSTVSTGAKLKKIIGWVHNPSFQTKTLFALNLPTNRNFLEFYE